MDEAKRELVHGWLTKALRDLASARKLAAEPDVYIDVAIYHCQQAAEKALKGYLVFCDQTIGKIHDLGVLVEQATALNAGFAKWQDAADALTPYATAFRYPGAVLEPSRDEFDSAVKHAEGIYKFVCSLLPGDLIPRTDPRK